MLDVAWPEIAVIGVVALVAIGPKDLPKVMRVAGQWAAKARGVARELQHSFEQLSYEAEIAEKLENEKDTVSSPSERVASAKASATKYQGPPKPPA